MADLSPLSSTQDSMRHIGPHSILARYQTLTTLFCTILFLFFNSRRPILFMKYT